jgi:hypothetical protein
MRYFALVDFRYVMLALFLGVIGAIAVYVAWGSYPARRRRKTKEEIRWLRGHEIDTGHHAEETPLAPFLIFIYVGVAVWAVVYMFFVGLRGGPVGY